MKQVQILGTGCAKCDKLHSEVLGAGEDAGLEIHVEKISDVGRMVELGVMMTPALVVDGEVKVVGKIPPRDQIIEWLK
jgi:small redox-active disulfide protein 2